MVTRYHLLKNCSTFYRLTQMRYGDWLRPYGLGAGQQYFLSHIAAYPGASMAELAVDGAYDNGTVTRAVKKLEENGYIRIEPDARDHRAKKLYPTEKGEAMLEPIRKMRSAWFAEVTEGFSEEEKKQLGALMARLADNARRCLEREQQNGEPRSYDHSAEALP